MGRNAFERQPNRLCWQTSSDNQFEFWRLDKRIKEDRKKTGVQLEISRSNLIYNIISLISDGAISFENLEEFSDELKETVNSFIER